MQDVFNRIKSLIRESSNILLVTHPRPDGDALGSTCAMIGYLRSINKAHVAFCIDPVPEHFKFLPFCEQITSELSTKNIQPDLVIVMDLPDWERAGVASFLNRIDKKDYRMVIMDHHTGNSSPADVYCIDPNYSSTCELLYEFFEFCEFIPNKHIANALLTGLLTDTENFTNPATSINSLKVAGCLMRLGANFDRLTDSTWRFRKFDELRLMGLVLNRLTYNEKVGLAIAVVTEEDQKFLKLSEDPFTGFPNFLKGITKGNAILLLVEDDGYIKGSFRSVNMEFDVRKVAELLGGGGHKLAAGFVMKGNLKKLSDTSWEVV